MKATRVLVGMSLAVGFGLVASQASALADKPDVKAAIGKAAPEFALKDAYGKEFKLSDYKGHVVVLEWTNQQCPYVVAHQKKNHSMQKDYATFAPKGVVWMAIDSTAGRTPEKIRVWAAENGIAYPMLLDPTGEVGHAYGAKTTPDMFVVNKEGILVYSGAIDDQKGHNYVTEALAAVLAGKTPPRSETTPYGCSVKYAKRVAKKGNGDGDGGNGGTKACSAKTCSSAKEGSTCSPGKCPEGQKTAKAGGNGGDGGHGGSCCGTK